MTKVMYDVMKNGCSVQKVDSLSLARRLAETVKGTYRVLYIPYTEGSERAARLNQIRRERRKAILESRG